NGRGTAHIDAYAGMKDVRIAYLVDPDTRLYPARLKSVESKAAKAAKGEKGEKADGADAPPPQNADAPAAAINIAPPKTIPDIRTALDDKDLDAVSIATPNHW